MTPSGVVTVFRIRGPGTHSEENDIAPGPYGNMWFTDAGANAIGRITMQGRTTEFPLPTPEADPNSIVAGPDGRMWFTEFGAGKIGRISV